MNTLSSLDIQGFILAHFRARIQSLGLRESEIATDLDLLATGVIDSLGILELIGAIEEHFGIIVDLEGLDAESLTLVRRLSDYIAKTATRK